VSIKIYGAIGGDFSIVLDNSKGSDLAYNATE